MGAEDTIRTGRSPFEIRETDKEYSGLTIADRYLENMDLERSFFNGVVLKNCWFESVALNDTELSEAKFERCRFENTNLGGCDFVDSTFEDTIFVNCSFLKGEWRDASFRHCQFIECSFIYTTVTLCTFRACTFDVKSLQSAEHRGVYFNIFSRCQLAVAVSDAVFASRNFGTPAEGLDGQLVPSESGTSIEQMCLLNNAGRFRVVSLVDVATSICTSLARKGYRRSSALTFFSKILRTLTDERRISATSLMYLEEVITGFGAMIDEQDLLMAAMSAVVEIHSALLAIASENPIAGEERPDTPVRKIKIRFSESYQRRQVEALRDALAAAADVHPDALNIDDVRPGSTIIDISTVVASVGGILVAVNFVLRQATVTVQHATNIKREFYEFQALAPPKKSSKRAVAIPSRTKIQATFQPDSAVPALGRLRKEVQRNGRDLIELDEPADVKMLPENVD
jgi:uncharacterized protein YjbI with pentapeptide repeats